MIYHLSVNQYYFRITTLGRRWNDVLSGNGALYLTPLGNRYNVVLQRATYVAETPQIVLSEAAYYMALIWQERIGIHHLRPVTGPLVSDHLLWQFTLQSPEYVIDVERLIDTLLWPPHTLVNPGRYYDSTQRAANVAVSLQLPGYSTPHPGIRVPAVRSRNSVSSAESNLVFFCLNRSPRGQLEGRWRIQIEFLALGGGQVTSATRRVDWARPRFRILAPVHGVPLGVATPGNLALSTWYSIDLNYH